MGNIIKFVEAKNTTIAKIIASVFVLTLLSASILPVFAAFNPGDTLDPGCLPSDPDCTVLISSGATTTWGAIVGTLSNQTDLQAILDGKLSTTTAAATYLTQADASSTYLTIINASTTNWNSFYDTPSSRITAGTGLSWSGNTLNATGGGSSQWLDNGSDIYFTAGNVGIGTSTPSTDLYVVGTTSASAFMSPLGYGGYRFEDANNGEYVDYAINIIGGYKNNSIAPGTVSSIIAGGGASSTLAGDDAANRILGTTGTHMAFSTISGGYDNQMDSAWPSVIAGGAHNRINMPTIVDYTIPVPGYIPNTATNHGTISGGSYNSIFNSIYGSIGGGTQNYLGYLGSTTDNSTIAGGANNRINGNNGTIAGGSGNSITGLHSTIGGGLSNTTSGGNSIFLGGGSSNSVNSSFATLGGGNTNSIGSGGTTFGSSAFLGGGLSNSIGAVSSSQYAVLSGGRSNIINGDYSTVLGGRDNVASSTYNVVGGRQAKATASGAWAFADSQASDFIVATANMFGARFSGGYAFTGGNVGIGTTTAGSKLTVIGDGWFGGNITATGTLSMLGTATSTFAGAVQATCFTTDGSTCITGGGGGSGTVNSGTAGQVAFYNANGTAVNGTSTLFIENENVGIGTITPSEKLSVDGNIQSSSLASGGDQCLRVNNDGVISTTGSDCSAASQWLNNASDIYFDTGNVGIGTNNPTSPLTIYDVTQTEKIFLDGSDENNITFGSADGGNQFQIGSYSNGFKIYDDTLGQAGLIIDNTGDILFGANATTTGLLTVLGTGTSTIEENLWVKGTLQTGTGSMFLDNDGLFASNGNIGLFNNADSYFTAGNFGLGTNSPTARFTIAQTANVATSGILITPAAGAPTGWTEQDSMGSMNWGDFVYSYDIAVSDDGMVIAAIGSTGAPDKVQVSTDGGTTWTERDPGSFMGFQAIAMSSDGSRIIVTEEATGAIYYSTNTGATWSGAVSTGSAFTLVAIAASDDGMTLVAVNNEGGHIFTSTNGGVSWNDDGTYLGIASFVATAVSADGTKMAIADEQFGSGGYIYTSTNSGASWTEQTSSPSIIWRGLTSSADGMKLAGVPGSGYVYTSTDGGANWTQQTGSGSRSWSAISSSADGQTLIASSFGYLYISTDGGVNWTQQTDAGSRSWRGADITGDGSKAAAMPASGYVYTYSGALPYSDREIYVDANDVLQIGNDGNGLGIAADGTVAFSGTTTATCFSTDGGATCIGGGGSGTVNSGLTGQMAFYGADGTTLSGTSTIIVSNEKVGIGTASPASRLQVETSNNGLNFLLGLRNTNNTESGGNAVGISFINENGFTNPKAAIVHERTAGYGTGAFRFLLNNENNDNPVTLSDTKMSILRSGNVGIGYTDPAYLLSVAGTIFAPTTLTRDSTDTYASILAGNEQYDATLYLSTPFGGNPSNGLKTAVISEGLSTYGRSNLHFALDNNGDTSTVDLSDSKMMITPAGNVGIGTTTPGSRLTVSGNSYFDGNTTASGVLSVLGVGTSTIENNLWVKGTLQTGTGSMFLNNDGLFSSNGNVGLFNNAASYINGNLGIGTTTPASLFTIAQSANTESNGILFAPVNSPSGWVAQTNSGTKSWNGITISADGLKIAALDSGLSGYINTSDDGGATWVEQTNSGADAWWDITSSADGSRIAAIEDTNPQRAYISTDSGANWNFYTVGGGIQTRSISMSADGMKLITADWLEGSIYTSTNGGVNWTAHDGPGDGSFWYEHNSAWWQAVGISADGNVLVAAANNGSGFDGSIWISTNGGTDWTEQTGAGEGDWEDLAVSEDGSHIVAVDKGGSIWTTANGGTNWVERTSAGTRDWVSVAMSADGNTIVAGVQSGYIYISTNGGADWTEQTSFGTRSNPRVAMTSDGSKIAESTSGEYVHIYSAGAPGTNRSIFVDSSDLLRIGTGTSTASLAISPTGSLGVGTTSSYYKLNVEGTVGFNGLSTAVSGDDAVCISAEGEIRINVSATDCSVSSQRYKHDINTLTATSGLSFVNQLRPVSFKMNGTEEAHLGFIAEEVAALDSRLTFTEADGITIRGIRYQEMTAVLAKAIQELDAKIASSTFDVASSSSFTASVASALSSITEWVGTKITVALGIFDRIETQTASVANGIEMKNEDGTLYCLRMVGNKLTPTEGSCTEASVEEEPIIESPELTDDTASTTPETEEETASSTPETNDETATSTDEVASSTEPIVEEETEATESEVEEEIPIIEEESVPESSEEVPAEESDSPSDEPASESVSE